MIGARRPRVGRGGLESVFGLWLLVRLAPVNPTVLAWKPSYSYSALAGTRTRILVAPRSYPSTLLNSDVTGSPLPTPDRVRVRQDHDASPSGSVPEGQDGLAAASICIWTLTEAKPHASVATNVISCSPAERSVVEKSTEVLRKKPAADEDQETVKGSPSASFTSPENATCSP